jgi:hypothetical protein
MGAAAGALDELHIAVLVVSITGVFGRTVHNWSLARRPASPSRYLAISAARQAADASQRPG